MKNLHVALFSTLILTSAVPCSAQSKSTDYLQKLSTKIKKHYFPHQHLKRAKDKIQFSLGADGKASNVKVLESNQKPKITKNEKAVLEYAISSSSPFEKPPTEIKCPAMIKVTLDNRNAKVAPTVVNDPAKQSD